MRRTSYLTKMTILATTAIAVGAIDAKASVDMTITGLGLSTTAVGLTGPNGISITPGNDYIGLYQFTVNSVGPGGNNQNGPFTAGQTFYSVCLSPSGVVDQSMHSYDYDSFEQVGAGLNPLNGNFTAGIQAAAWLWANYGAPNGAVTTGDQGAGLALAMYSAYYGGGVTPLFNGDAAAAAAYTTYMGYLATYLVGPPGTLTGYMLVPDPTGSDAGQEFIVFAPSVSNLGSVPEPTTVIAGALLLLPFGASTFRVLRRKSKAS